MKTLALALLSFALSFPAAAEKEDSAPLVGTQKHRPIAVRKCSCKEGTQKDSHVPLSRCEGTIHGKISEFPVYHDICRSLEMSQRAEGPTETATSFLGPKEVIVGVSYGDSSFLLSEEWMRTVISN